MSCLKVKITANYHVHKSTIMLVGFWAKIEGVLRDAASTATGGKRTALTGLRASQIPLSPWHERLGSERVIVGPAPVGL